MKFMIVSSSGADYENLKVFISKSDIKEQFELKDYVSENEIIELLQKAFALFFVSKYEGVGIPVIEAQAAGTPVITSDTSSLIEIGKGSALCCNPEDAMEIAKNIEKLSDHKLYEDLQQKGYENCKKYTWSNCAHSIWSMAQSI